MRHFFGMPHLVSGVNFLVLSLNLIPVPVSVRPVHALPHLITLSTHHSHHPYLPLSFTPDSRPTSYTSFFPAASRLTPQTFMIGPFLQSISVFVFSFFVSLSCLVPCGRLSRLLVSFLAHVNIIRRIVWYHNIVTSN